MVRPAWTHRALGLAACWAAGLLCSGRPVALALLIPMATRSGLGGGSAGVGGTSAVPPEAVCPGPEWPEPGPFVHPSPRPPHVAPPELAMMLEAELPQAMPAQCWRKSSRP